MKPRLRIEVVPLVHPDAESDLDATLDLLAGAFAEICISQARAEVAAELGVPAESLNRELEPLASELRPLGLARNKESA